MSWHIIPGVYRHTIASRPVKPSRSSLPTPSAEAISASLTATGTLSQANLKGTGKLDATDGLIATGTLSQANLKGTGTLALNSTATGTLSQANLKATAKLQANSPALIGTGTLTGTLLDANAAAGILAALTATGTLAATIRRKDNVIVAYANVNVLLWVTCVVHRGIVPPGFTFKIEEVRNVRGAQFRAGWSDPNYRVVDNNTFSYKSDNQHLDTAGAVACGQAIWAAYKSNQNNS